MTDQAVTYTPQFHPPTWRDNVDLISAEGSNGFNIQFQNLRSEFDTLSSIVKTLSDTLNNLSQALNQVQQTANTANSTANTAIQTRRWGYINSNGTIVSGSQNFTVTKSGTGLYDIFFNPAFSSIPVIQANQVFTGDTTYGGGSTLDNAVIVGITSSQCRIKTGSSDGNASDRNFSFIALVAS